MLACVAVAAVFATGLTTGCAYFSPAGDSGAGWTPYVPLQTTGTTEPGTATGAEAP